MTDDPYDRGLFNVDFSGTLVGEWWACGRKITIYFDDAAPWFIAVDRDGMGDGNVTGDDHAFVLWSWLHGARTERACEMARQ